MHINWENDISMTNLRKFLRGGFNIALKSVVFLAINEDVRFKIRLIQEVKCWEIAKKMPEIEVFFFSQTALFFGLCLPT